MKSPYVVTALVESGAGIALLCCPSLTVELLVGTPLDMPAALIVARIGGVAVVSLGVVCWLARNDAGSRAARGLIAAMLIYNIAVPALLVYAWFGYGLHGVALWPGVALHAVMTVWCVLFLRASLPNSAIHH